MTQLTDDQIDTVNEIVTKLLDLQQRYDIISGEIEQQKKEIRNIANGEKMEISIPGSGSVTVSKPRKGGVVTGVSLSIDEERLNSVPDLRHKLLEKGILKETEKISAPAAASVTIKLNV